MGKGTIAPCAGEYLPATQSLHPVLDSLYFPYLPSEHNAQAAEPLTALNFPAAQGTHETVETPSIFDSWPAGQIL